MPFLRFTRDKRGYEYFYLVEMAPGRRGRTRPRVLFWFRTPPNVKVGREPFSDEVRRALEAKYPDLVFDWKKLSATPAPPAADPERWRERRRAERVARQAAVDADSDVTRDEEPDAPGPPDEPAHDQPPVVSTSGRDAANPDREARNPNHAATDPGREAALNVQQDTPAGEAASQSAFEAVRRKRRRRRGRRSGSASASGDGNQSTAPTPPVDSSEDKV